MFANDATDQCACPPIGAHVVTPRRAYTHHGIYVGDGRYRSSWLVLGLGGNLSF